MQLLTNKPISYARIFGRHIIATPEVAQTHCTIMQLLNDSYLESRTSDKAKAILIGQNGAYGKQRMTIIMHELGHYFLKHHRTLDQTRWDVFMQEVEADIWAAKRYPVDVGFIYNQLRSYTVGLDVFASANALEVIIQVTQAMLDDQRDYPEPEYESEIDLEAED